MSNPLIPDALIWGKPILSDDLTMCSASGCTYTNNVEGYTINVQSTDKGMQIDIHHDSTSTVGETIYYLSYTWDEWAEHLAEYGTEKED